MLDFLSKKYKLTEEVSLMFTDIDNTLQHSESAYLIIKNNYVLIYVALDSTKTITAFINTRYSSQMTIREFSKFIPFPIFSVTRSVDDIRPCSFFECSFLFSVNKNFFPYLNQKIFLI